MRVLYVKYKLYIIIYLIINITLILGVIVYTTTRNSFYIVQILKGISILISLHDYSEIIL